jgi:hypothetical protein
MKLRNARAKLSFLGTLLAIKAINHGPGNNHGPGKKVFRQEDRMLLS